MSSFSYSITRPYPFRWFTPTAVAGGIILAALFSAINFFSNAYNMITITTNDPDIVEANHWSGRVPGTLTSKIQPTCEDAIIPVGSNINTNQTVFSYQLVRVQDHPALAYHNKPLKSCEVTQILIDFQTNNGRQAALIDRSAWGATVNADITCLRARYDPLSWTAEPGVSGFIRVNASTPGFLWAETLLLGFWTETVTAIMHQTVRLNASDTAFSQFNLSSGYVTFERPMLDIKNASFFNQGQYAFFDDESKGFRGDFSSQANRPFGSLITNASWPNIWAPADRLAKAMFSTITADLGQTSTVYISADGTPTDMSMITTPDRLHHWTENLTQIWDASTISNKISLLGYGWMQLTQYQPSKYPVTFSPSTISATYTCQVPRLKSGANIFISVLVADLVLLRAAWTLYNYLVDWFLKTRHSDANLCLGCVQRNRDDGSEDRQHVIVGADKDIGSRARNIALQDLERNRKADDEQSLQKLLTRKPVEV
ncbi:hypothetical protein E4T44_03787 [Aureobasidium sp. EXF-8845]|nr:hypothetical protein E4T44_03787 [Aureobasidium sp. EXF-8845]KAI4854784.1 hypothetical protein E4T45_03789 [Aureobasidium sp. EXF-8846]